MAYSKAKKLNKGQGQSEINLNSFAPTMRAEHHGNIEFRRYNNSNINIAEKEDAENLYDFGLNLGIAFQIKDDILDVFGDAALVGKKVGGDILANKKTYLLLKALEDANESQNITLKSWLSKEGGADKVEAAATVPIPILFLRKFLLFI